MTREVKQERKRAGVRARPSAIKPSASTAARSHTATMPVDLGEECRVCGCSDLAPCAGGCEWIEADLCSNCIASDLDDGEPLDLEVPRAQPRKIRDHAD